MLYYCLVWYLYIYYVIGMYMYKLVVCDNSVVHSTILFTKTLIIKLHTILNFV